MIEALALGIDLIGSGDAALFEIVLLSLRVSLSATLIACLIGLPLGAALLQGVGGRGASMPQRSSGGSRRGSP